MQQGGNLLHARELMWHSYEDLGAVETTHLHTKELKSARGRDPYPRLPIIKGEFRPLSRISHLQAGINPNATRPM